MASIALVLKELNSVIADGSELTVKKESIKELISFLERIKLLLEEQNSSISTLGSSEGTAALIEGLKSAQLLLNRHKHKRRLYWTICLPSVNQEVEEIVHLIGKSLQQLRLLQPRLSEESCVILDDLVVKMQQVHYEATDDERHTILDHGIDDLTRKFAKDLGINSERDKQLLSRELRYLKADLNCEKIECQKLMRAVDDVLEALACDTSVLLLQEENEAIPSFEAFECPLTKQIMKDPVVLESSHTYERQSIEEWFKTCRKMNREPTCPISGMVLTSTELHANIGLRKTIEEWYRRNVAARIGIVRDKLKALSPMEDVDGALDEILRLVSENSMNKVKLKEANIIPDIAKIWSLDGAAYFRAKALAVLDKMAADDAHNQHVIVKEGLLRCTVRSLGSTEDEEKANALNLLFTFSKNLEICTTLGSQKGAIIHLVGLSTGKDQDLAGKAENTLKNLEEVDSNILQMADSGRIQPLITRVCEGSEDKQIQMAKLLAQRHLVKSQKKLVAESAAASLLAMLSGTVEARKASLELFVVLSSLEENRRVLIDAGLLSPLLHMMFDVHSSMNAECLKLKQSAAVVVSNLVSAPGSWENRSIDSEGNTMHSEFVIHNILGLLAHAKPDWKHTLLQILIALTSSPEVADESCSHINSGHGIRCCFGFLSESVELSQRVIAVKLLAAVSDRLGMDIVRELNQDGGEIGSLTALLRSRNNEERAAAACIIGNIPLTEKEVSRFLAPELISWIVETLTEIRSSKQKSYTRLMTETIEGLLGMLLHFLKSKNPAVVSELRQHHVMTILLNQFERQGEFVIKQRAALGIKYLSDKAPGLTKAPQPPKKQWVCFIPPKASRLCPVHSGRCDDAAASSVCMIESKALVPVLELLEEDDESVQLAALAALSTLLTDAVNIRGATEELVKVDGLQKIVELFIGQQKGELQDRAIWMIERALRTEEYSKSYSVDTTLFRALIEAFKYGNTATKALAQDALTNLKQLSGVSAGNKLRKQR